MAVHGSTTSCETPEIRRFGSGRDPLRDPRPDRNPDRQLRALPAVQRQRAPSQKRKDEGLEAVLREIFPIESYDKTHHAWSTSATSWASRATSPTSAASCG